MASDTYEEGRAKHELAALRALKKRSGRLGSGVTLTGYVVQERDTAVRALEALMQYTGGWDAPAGHPCRTAREVLEMLLPKEYPS